ncbi:MAG TPA: DNA-directed RNA polymerase subunit alpha C-terminal domain-containing protein [Candidatus Egerieousia sp.]|nr:DNA-directed RNA polymerase subunit alpha C-terminal domain-containing protein [Candidatus Egerieousia sp.]HPT05377.1 DNA-directed RNA polymerase subunit alpha C-terminal domain-containing protein [Candidatus Egerieousia sp.]
MEKSELNNNFENHADKEKSNVPQFDRDFRLSGLCKAGIIPVRVVNGLKAANIFTLNELINLFYSGYDFSKLRNIGPDSLSVIQNICTNFKQFFLQVADNLPDIVSFEEHTILRPLENDIQLSKLYADGLLSVRTVNGLKQAKISTVNELINAHNNYFDFKRLHNIGQHSLQEITELCLKVNDSTGKVVSQKFEKFIEEVSHISLLKNDICLSKLLSLGLFSSRTANVLKSLEVEYINKLIELYNSNFDFSKTQNIDYKSIFEINFLCRHSRFICEIATSPLCKYLILFKGQKNELRYIKQFYGEFKKLPMFFISETYFINTQRSGLREWAICNGLHGANENLNNLPLREKRKAKRVPLSVKKAHLFDENTDWQYYYTDLNCRNVIFENDSELQNIICAEGSKISLKFAMLLLDIAGLYSMHRIPHLKNKYCVIRRKLTDIFQFDVFFNYLFGIFKENRVDDQYINVEKLVNSSGDSWKIGNYLQYVKPVTEIICSICKNAFSWNVQDGELLLPANMKLLISDLVYKILLEKQSKMTINDIIIELHRRNPEFAIFPESIKSIMLKDARILPIGKSGEYFLKGWDQYSNKTIRQHIVDYLGTQLTPQLVTDIYSYVRQYYPKTNIPSIRTSMNILEDEFIYYGNDLYGLANKKYPPEFTQKEKKRNIRPLYGMFKLVGFTSKYKRLPNLDSADCKEQNLAKWCDKLALYNPKDEYAKNIKDSIMKIIQEYS